MTPNVLVRTARLASPTADSGGRRPANVRASVSADLRRLMIWGALLGMIGIGY